MEQRWALITGASAGLGVEFARLAAAEGWSLVLAARRRSEMETLAATLPVTCVVIDIDLSQPRSGDVLWEMANEGRQIDLLINNAGLGAHGPFGSGETDEREDTSIAVNVVAYTDLMQRAVADFRQRGIKGQVLNVASLAGYMPGPGMAVYHATKAYALSLSDAVHSEAQRDGITVTALCPGATRTEFFDAAEVKRTWLMTVSTMGDAASVARAGWDGLRAGRRRVVPGIMNKLSMVFARLLPSAVMTPLVGRLLAKNL